MDKVKLFCSFCMKEHEIEIRKEKANGVFKHLSIEYEEEFCVCTDTNEFFFTEEQLKKKHNAINEAYDAKLTSLIEAQAVLGKGFLLLDKEQLEVVYRAVKTCYQSAHAKTLTNNEAALKLRDVHNKHIEEYKAIMKFINEHTGNILDEM